MVERTAVVEPFSLRAKAFAEKRSCGNREVAGSTPAAGIFLVINMISIFKKVEGGEMRTLDNIEKGSWINVISPTIEEMEDLKVKLNVPDDFISAATDDDEKPRYEMEEKSKLFIFRVPTIEEDSVVTHPLSIIINSDNITTVHLKKLEILEPFKKGKVKGFSTTKRTRFLLQILLNINKHFLRMLDSIEKQIEESEKNLPRSLRNEEILKLLSVQKTLTYFSTAAISNKSVLDLIMKGNIVRLFEEDEDILEDIIIENNQCIDMVSVYGKILNNMMNASASIVSNNINAVMKILASITILLSIPTIITSFYGMNVSLPLQTHPTASFLTILISIFLMFLVIIIFSRKRWI
jgi:magnesium transporter